MQQLCDHGDKDWSQPSLISDNDPYLTTAEQQVSAASFPLLPLARAVPCGVGQRLKQNLALEALVVLCGTARAGCDNCCRIIRWGTGVEGSPCSPPSWPNWEKLAQAQGTSVFWTLLFAL